MWTNFLNCIRTDNLFQYFETLFFLFCISTSCSHERINEVCIYYTSESTHTAVPVPCDLFEFTFQKIAKKQIIKDEAFLRDIETHLNALSPANNSSIIIDVRIKCYVKSNKKTDTLCFTNDGIIIYNRILMEKDQKLIHLIRDNLN